MQTNKMKFFILILSIIVLESCESSNNDSSINGTWSSCHDLGAGFFVYEELIVNNSNFEVTSYNALDSQCVKVQRPTEAATLKTTSTSLLDNLHTSNTGLPVYDLTLINRIRETNLGTTLIPDFYTIIYRDLDRLYFGDVSGSNDGTTNEKRPTDIAFDRYYTKQ